MAINIRGIEINDRSDIEDILSAFSILNSEVEILKNELSKQFISYDDLSNNLIDDYSNRKELLQAISNLQIEAKELLECSKNISEQNEKYYQNVKLSLERELASLNQKITKTLTGAVENLPLDKLNIEVLDKIEFAFVHFEALKRNLTNLQNELEHTQKFSRGILDDVATATIRSNRLNDKINAKMNLFFAGVAGIIFALLLQNYKFFLNLSTHIRIADWQGFLIFFSIVVNIGVGGFFVWKIVSKIISEEEKEKYIV